MGVGASAGTDSAGLLDAFKVLDKDASGKLSTDEVKDFMQGLDKEAWTDDVCAALFKEADTDEDGAISTEEFIGFLKDCEHSSAFFDLGEDFVDEDPYDVFHCTLMEHANSIEKEGFRFPVKGVTENQGWKLGYAVYFGSDPKYCVHEALNTFREQGKQPDPATELAMIKVTVKRGRYRKLGNYNELHETSGMSKDDLDELTEQLDHKTVGKYGYDTLSINDATDCAEVVVYDKSSIISMEVFPASKYL